MIIDVKGNKTTPKRYAQDLIMEALADKRGYWMEQAPKQLTSREIRLICEQMEKECNRIAKRYGFKESWIS
jgi:hypothetical protein